MRIVPGYAPSYAPAFVPDFAPSHAPAPLYAVPSPTLPAAPPPSDSTAKPWWIALVVAGATAFVFGAVRLIVQCIRRSQPPQAGPD